MILGVGAFALALAPAQATTPLGAQTQISVTGADGDSTLDATDASVAYNPVANQFLVVWSGSDAGGDEIFARLVDAAGAPLGAQFRISDMGPPAAAGFTATTPAVAYNARRNEYLVVWSGDDDAGPLVDDELEIFAQRLTAGGDEVGANDPRISDIGPNGDTAFSARDPAVVYNPSSDEYLVAWEGDPDAAPFVGGEEIFVQRLSATGAQAGANDRRISDMGPDGDTAFSAENPAVAHNPTSNQYLVAWEGDDDTGPLVVDEIEIFAQRLAANGTEEGDNDRRISDMGPDGDAGDDFEAKVPSLAYNPASDEYLVVWEGSDDTAPLGPEEDEIYAQRLAASGAQVGTNDRRISQMGPDGDSGFDARDPHVVVGTRANEYLVAWDAEDDAGALVNEEDEVYAQRLGPDGAEVGGDDVRVSVMGVDGDNRSGGHEPALAYGSQANEYLIAWHGDTTVAPRVNDEFEVYARRFGAGAPVASGVCKVLPPVPPPSPGDPDDITLTTGQLLINQRIDQAAIRRANGVSAWLGDGIEGRDLCQGALAASELAPGIVTDGLGPPGVFAAPDPRPIVVAPAKPGDASEITLSVGQLLINQRISQAAIRRLNALKARMDGGLTGGDVDDATLTQPVFISGLRVRVAPPPASAPPASTTDIAPARPGDPSQVTLTTGQLLINQRISQAAVRRANDLIARIEDGLLAGDVRDATVTALDLAPGVVVP